MMRRLDVVFLCMLVIASACASTPNPEPAATQGTSPPAPTSGPAPAPGPDWAALERAPIDPSLPPCDAEPLPLGRPCRLIGVYTLISIRSKGPGVLAVWPSVATTTGGSALIGSLWFPEDRPDPGTLARYEGKRVEIVGLLNRSPPHKNPANQQNLIAMTLKPIHALRVLGDAP